MAIYYVTRVMNEDSELLLEDFGAVCDEEALGTHEELIALVESGELAEEKGVPPYSGPLTVQTYCCIDGNVIAESRLEPSGEHYEVTHTIGYW